MVAAPGINDHRKWFTKFDGCTLNSIPDKLTAVTYCDGDFSQIDAIKSSIELFIDNKMIANKQHASWSGVEQPADLARVFKLIKNMLPLHTVKNIPAERCPMKALMLDAFKEKLEHLNLAPNRRHSLVDFISSLSVKATKACTVKHIQHRFIKAGMIDAENLRYPVFDKIIATCRWNPSVEEYKNIENNMNTIIHKSCEFGHISKEVYDRLNIVRERDKMGHEVMRDATITQESYQRTKCLTHEHQLYLKKERRSQNQRIETERKELTNRKHQEKMTCNDAIVGNLFKKLELGGLLSVAEIGTVKEK
jgi:hypothetical protein